MSSTKDAVFDPTRKPFDEHYITRTFSSFIAVSSDGLVQFAHYTVKEYLQSNDIKKGPARGFYIDDITANAFVARSCLSYLIFCDSQYMHHETENDDCQNCPRLRPLLEYAANNWYRHALKMTTTGTPREARVPVGVTISQEGILQPEEIFQSTILSDGIYTAILYYLLALVRLMSVLLKRTGPANSGQNGRLTDSEDISTPGNGTRDAPSESLSEWAESTRSMFDQISDLEAERYRNTLKAAACRGYEMIVELVLAHGTPVNTRSRFHTSEIWRTAIFEKYDELLRLLLGKTTGASAESVWWPKQGDLRSEAKAVFRRRQESVVHEAVVKLLLEKGADVESKSSSSRTPLSWAAENGHEAVVKLLLEKGADVESKDTKSGQTPLLRAAEYGHEAVVKLLLKKGADVESKSRSGQTPLSLAAGKGHEAVVKLLLNKGADVESKDTKSGKTPLSLAAGKGHEAVVKLLLEKRADVESRVTGSGQTPLWWAAAKGHEGVVKLLLEKGVDVESKSRSGQTPLSLAAGNGHEAVAKLLLEKGADVESKSRSGLTPLSWAAENGHGAVVKLLLEKGADVDFKDSRGRTPLSWAAAHGHEAVVKLLLAKHGVDPDSKDSGGRTPLSWAAAHGHLAVVKLLQSRDSLSQ